MIIEVPKKNYKSINFLVLYIMMLLLCSCGDKQQTFTKPEYIKEVIAQKENFNKVWDYAQDKKVTMRRSAYIAAIKRVADIVALRGVYL